MMENDFARIFSSHDANVPFWPVPFCVVENIVGTCTLFGITVSCMEPITWNSQFASGIEGGHIWTFMVLLLIGVGAMAYVKVPWRWQDSMKITCALYAVVTACFAVFRIYWGLSKPLLGGAALHNLFEWGILLHLVTETKNFASLERNIQFATFWIFIVVSFTTMIPNLLLAFLVEQMTGIMLDFGMPLLYLSVYFDKAATPEVRSFYRLPLIAHTVHIFFTIIPLVMSTFFVGRVSWYSSFWNEISIYVSAPITHVMYIVWSHRVDEIRLNERDLTSDEKVVDQLLPPKYRLKGAKYCLGVGFLFGTFTLLGVPFWMGTCPKDCASEGPITGTSIAFVNRGQEARFIELIQQVELAKVARRAKGNIDYKIVQSMDNPREFRFIETWSSDVAVGTWLNDGLSSQLFRTPEMKDVVLAGGAIKSAAYYKTMGAKCAANTP